MVKVFLSYSSKHPDEPTEVYKALRRDGYSPWMDNYDIPGGELWENHIPHNVETSVVVLIFVTSDILISQPVRDEIKIAISHHKIIIPLIFNSFADFPAVLKQLHLQEYQAIDFISLGFQVGYAKLLDTLAYWTYPYKLEENLQHFNAQFRLKTLYQIEVTQIELQNERVLSVLITALSKESDIRVAETLIDIIGRFHYPQAVETLLTVLRAARNPFSDGFLLSTAAKRLGQIGKDSSHARTLLLEAKNDPIAMVKQAAAQALLNFDVEAQEMGFSTLVSMLNDKAVSIRRDAIRALGEFGDRRAVEYLIPLLSDPEDVVCQNAKKTLKALGYSTLDEPN